MTVVDMSSFGLVIIGSGKRESVAVRIRARVLERILFVTFMDDDFFVSDG